MTKKLIRIGSSCGLILPSEEVTRLHLKPGDRVEIFSDGNTLKVVPIRKIRAVSLGGLWKALDIGEKEIKKARREAWGKFYR